MPYSLWLDGVQLGTTDLDVFPMPGRRAGILQPTAQGLALLPSVTAVVPAMFDFHRLCKARGIDPALEDEERTMAALDALEHTPAVVRMRAAIDRIAKLELRDHRGTNVPWTYILVTDMEELRALAAQQEGVDEPRAADVPIRYLISATFARDATPGARARPAARAMIS